MPGKAASGASGTSGGAVATRETDISHFFLVKIALTGTSYADVGYFASVDGLSRRFQPFVYAEGGRSVPHVLMTPSPFGEVTLRWGHMERTTLHAWMGAVAVGAGFRRNVQILQYARDMKTMVRTYTLARAWPVEWRGATLTAEESRVAIEQLSLMFDDLTLTVGA